MGLNGDNEESLLPSYCMFKLGISQCVGQYFYIKHLVGQIKVQSTIQITAAALDGVPGNRVSDPAYTIPAVLTAGILNVLLAVPSCCEKKDCSVFFCTIPTIARLNVMGAIIRNV